MEEALLNPDLSVTIKDSPIPIPDADQVVVKVAYVAANPAD
jgi:NADPH:quinone reductase-like Zn-dependent oxidoreductase